MAENDIKLLIRAIKNLLGITQIEQRLTNLEEKIDKLKPAPAKYPPKERTLNPETILNALDKPMTTVELAKKVGKTRSWVSLLLNQLEKEGKVKKERRNREIVYHRNY